MYDAIGVILARGGSKRLPGKHLLKLCGKPMVEWTIIAACESRSLKRVILSSDDEQILKTGLGHNVLFRQRPASLAEDTTSSYAPIRDAANRYLSLFLHTTTVVLLQPTSPLRTASDIDRFMNNYSGHPMQSCCRHDAVQNRHVADGAIYAAPLGWLLEGNTWDDPYVKPWYRCGYSVDVNTAADFDEAKKLMTMGFKSKGSSW